MLSLSCREMRSVARFHPSLRDILNSVTESVQWVGPDSTKVTFPVMPEGSGERLCISCGSIRLRHWPRAATCSASVQNGARNWRRSPPALVMVGAIYSQPKWTGRRQVVQTEDQPTLPDSDSLAGCYTSALRSLEHVLGKKLKRIHILSAAVSINC